MAKTKALSNLSFIEVQNREGVREVMNVTDAALVSFKPLPVLETGSPNKYFDALAAGKLIVINFGGWVKEEIEKYQCGIAINSPENFIEKIKPFIESADQLKAYQSAARRLAETTYSRKVLSEKFSGLVDS
jgi:hypothetical protein